MYRPRTWWQSRARWRKNLYVLFFAELLSVTGFLMVTPFLSLYIEQLGARFLGVEFWAGAAFSILSLTRIVASPVWGALADRFGRKVMVQRAMFAGTLVVGMMTFVHTAEQLVVLRALQGALTGTVVAANTLVAASAPPERNGYAMGLMQTSVWIGASVGPLIGGLVADRFGFRVGFSISAAYLLLAGLGVTFMVQEEFEPSQVPRLTRREILRDLSHVLGLPGMRRVLAIRLLIRSRMTVLMAFLPLFVAQLLTSPETVSTVTGLATGVGAMCGALSAAYLGRVGDKLGHRPLLLAGAAGTALGYVSLALLVGREWQLIGLMGLIGIGLGVVEPATKALINQRAASEQMGSVYGVDASITSIGRVILPLLGSLTVAGIGLRGIFWLLAVIFVLVFLFAIDMERAEISRVGG
jgi:DHA1 family multidrug resistance protein-like MFS transporter